MTFLTQNLSFGGKRNWVIISLVAVVMRGLIFLQIKPATTHSLSILFLHGISNTAAFSNGYKY